MTRDMSCYLGDDAKALPVLAREAETAHRAEKEGFEPSKEPISPKTAAPSSDAGTRMAASVGDVEDVAEDAFRDDAVMTRKGMPSRAFIRLLQGRLSPARYAAIVRRSVDPGATPAKGKGF